MDSTLLTPIISCQRNGLTCIDLLIGQRSDSTSGYYLQFTTNQDRFISGDPDHLTICRNDEFFIGDNDEIEFAEIIPFGVITGNYIYPVDERVFIEAEALRHGFIELTDLNPSTTYYLRLMAVSESRDAFDSKWSDTFTATTMDITIGAVFEAHAVSASVIRLNLPNETGGLFDIQRRLNGEHNWTTIALKISGRSYDDNIRHNDGLLSNRRHDYRIRVNESAWSQSDTAWLTHTYPYAICASEYICNAANQGQISRVICNEYIQTRPAVFEYFYFLVTSEECLNIQMAKDKVHVASEEYDPSFITCDEYCRMTSIGQSPVISAMEYLGIAFHVFEVGGDTVSRRTSVISNEYLCHDIYADEYTANGTMIRSRSVVSTEFIASSILTMELSTLSTQL